MSTCAPGKVKSELFYKNSRQNIYISSPVMCNIVENQIIKMMVYFLLLSI